MPSNLSRLFYLFLYVHLLSDPAPDSPAHFCRNSHVTIDVLFLTFSVPTPNVHAMHWLSSSEIIDYNYEYTSIHVVLSITLLCSLHYTGIGRAIEKVEWSSVCAVDRIMYAECVFGKITPCILNILVSGALHSRTGCTSISVMKY